MKARICYSMSITEKECKPCSVEKLKELMALPRVQEICDRIKLLDGKDPEEVGRLKKQLPIITPHAKGFAIPRPHEGGDEVCQSAEEMSGPRKAEYAIPSGLVMLDVDHVESPRAWWEEAKTTQKGLTPLCSFEEMLRANGICLVAITPSGHGLRVIGERLRGESIECGQARLAQTLGIEQYDSCTKDLSRASFVMPKSYVLYMDEEVLERESECSLSDGQSHTDSTRGTAAMPSENRGAEYRGVSYRGVSYEKIVEHLVNLLGGSPSVGERNTFYFTLVKDLRYICDFDAGMLLSVLPEFGLSEQERKSVIQSAINRPRRSDVPDIVNRAIASAEAEKKGEDESATKGMVSGSGSLSLPRLPKALEIICKRLPESFRPAMIIASLPILGALATRVRFRYLDNAEHSFSFMSCITAPAATGKSFIRRPINLLLTPIDEQDEIEREREQDYKDALRASKNSKHQPENPRACPRNNGINISVAKLLQLLTYSEGKHLVAIGEEIDTLLKSERAGVWSQKSDIYRYSFDNARYGNSALSEQSFCANVQVFYNILITGTPGGMYRFFKDVEDGLVTRFCFAQLPDMFGSEIPEFQKYTAAEEAEVVKIARKLDMAKGTISCPAVDAAIRVWLEEKRQLAIESDSRAIDTLRRRSAVIGFRAGYLARVMEGTKSLQSSKAGGVKSTRGTAKIRESEKLSAEFAVWVAEYVFRNQMELFGSQFERVADEYLSSVSSRGKVRQLLQSLPESFSRADLMAIRARNGQSTEVKVVLSRWRANGLIEEVEPGKYRKV